MSDLPTREELVDLCDRAIVPQARWHDRDSADAQRQVGALRALLLAGCEYGPNERLKSDELTIWVEVTYEGFAFHDWGGPANTKTYYLPTAARLAEREGQDWY